MSNTNKVLIGIGGCRRHRAYHGRRQRHRLEKPSHSDGRKHKTAWAQVETQLQRRLDLIPNLVETVKGYAKHEERVFTEVTKARASVAGASPVRTRSTPTISSPRRCRGCWSLSRVPGSQGEPEFPGAAGRACGNGKPHFGLTPALQRGGAGLKPHAENPVHLVAAGFKEAPYFEAAPEAREAPKVKF